MRIFYNKRDVCNEYNRLGLLSIEAIIFPNGITSPYHMRTINDEEIDYIFQLTNIGKIWI